MGNFISAHKNYILNAGGKIGSVWADAGGPVNAWMSADFNPAQDRVKKSEGGYTNNPSDNGNWTGGKIGVGTLIGTNHGISAPVLVDELKRLGGAPPTASTMKNLSYAAAAAIYKRMFWDKIKGDDIKDQNVANTVYDAYVNQTGWTRKMIEDALQQVGKKATVTVPLKSDTIAVINSVPPAKFYSEFNRQRAIRYKETAARPGQAQFLKGWMNRLATFDTLGALNRNKGKTVLVVLGLSALIGGGIYYYRNK